MQPLAEPGSEPRALHDAPPFDELVELAGATSSQRAELARDHELARELLAQAIARRGVKHPAAYALAGFRRRRSSSRTPSSSTPSSSTPRAPEPEAGPPDDETIARVLASPELRALMGPAVAAALRRHGRAVPPALR